jgi:DNA polymerase III gamma/tau subunit
MSFKDICGQEKPIAFLKNALERERVSHAYLFFGLSGVGKRTTAEIFASK